jgi:hypothetical protein
LNDIHFNSLNVKEREEGRGREMALGRSNDRAWKEIYERRGKEIKGRKLKMKILNTYQCLPV